ncbi:MAG: ORF6N domain-containing protein [Bacteroidales bacterium]|nr:ORF6N domain-containing protein [Bacteroidales bacterium]
MIFTIRGVQVMFDRDLAQLYGVETRVLNQAVKRNADRFPSDFMFQLTQDETDGSRSQIVTLNGTADLSKSQNVTLNTGRGHNIKYLPYVFTENGVAMLSSVLRSQTAIEVNIQIMRAFTAMRHFLISNAAVFQRIENLEQHQIATDQRIDRVFQLLEAGQQPQQGIFFDGQIFDAHTFVSDLIRSAKKRIVLFDNYIDDTVLTLLDKRKQNVDAEIFTKTISQQLSLDIAKHNAQYRPITVTTFDKTHDRFLCIDSTVYHIGASLKDLGKKWFAFSKMVMSTDELINKL